MGIVVSEVTKRRQVEESDSDGDDGCVDYSAGAILEEPPEKEIARSVFQDCTTASLVPPWRPICQLCHKAFALLSEDDYTDDATLITVRGGFESKPSKSFRNDPPGRDERVVCRPCWKSAIGRLAQS